MVSEIDVTNPIQIYLYIYISIYLYIYIFIIIRYISIYLHIIYISSYPHQFPTLGRVRSNLLRFYATLPNLSRSIVLLCCQVAKSNISSCSILQPQPRSFFLVPLQVTKIHHTSRKDTFWNTAAAPHNPEGSRGYINPITSHETSWNIFLWFSYGFPMVSYGFPTVFLWHTALPFTRVTPALKLGALEGSQMGILGLKTCTGGAGIWWIHLGKPWENHRKIVIEWDYGIWFTIWWIIKHGWLENPRSEWRSYVLGTSLISAVHGFQLATFDETGGYRYLYACIMCPMFRVKGAIVVHTGFHQRSTRIVGNLSC